VEKLGNAKGQLSSQVDELSRQCSGAYSEIGLLRAQNAACYVSFISPRL